MEKIKRVVELLRRAYLETLACYVPFKSIGEKALNDLISENLIENIKGVVVFSDYKERAEKALEFLLSKNLVDKKFIEEIEENSKHWYDLKHRIEEYEKTRVEKRADELINRAEEAIRRSKELIDKDIEDLREKRFPARPKRDGENTSRDDKIKY